VSRVIINESIPTRTRPRFPRNFIELLRNASPHTVRLSLLAVVLAWVPLIGLSAVQGWAFLKSFLVDSAAQSRLLLVIPLLILTEPQLAARLSHIAQHFLAADLVKKEDIPRFGNAIADFKRRAHSQIARIVIAILIFAFMGLALRYAKPGLFPAWCYGKNGELSTAGIWYAFTSLSIMNYLVVHCVWRQLLWTSFLHSVSRIGLRLIPAHPDLMGGLSFVETSIRGYLSFGFAVGTIAAGAVANQMFRFQRPLVAFKHVPLVVVAVVVLVCVGPLFSIYGILLRTRSQGIFQYGSLATHVGHLFETKWLNRKVDVDALDAPDFSATIDLYSVVGNVRQMSVVPVTLSALVRLIAVTLAPAVPVALVALPFDVLFQNAIKYLA
jgi:hypothetical protein